MSLFVKVCGLTDANAVQACVEAGVDAVGFVFASSPRRVTPDQAASLAASIPNTVLKVAVFRRPTPTEIAAMLRRFTPDLIQADHDTLGELSPDTVLPVHRQGGAMPASGRFLFEGPLSGIGQPVDLATAVEAARVGEMVLAGGLSSVNVFDVVTAVRPFGVDVSSGVESSPGTKSGDLIRAFVAAARAAEQRLVTT